MKLAEKDRVLLEMAIETALSGIDEGGGPFGAVITCGGKVIAKEYNKVVKMSDPTAHAEILAIRKASKLLKTHNLKGCTLYSSCEPCPMCIGAIYWAGIDRVVYASDRNQAEEAGFIDSMIYNEISANPSDRKIRFTQTRMDSAEELFRKWKDTENKIPY